MNNRKDSGTSYTTQNLKQALAAAKVRKALDELRESVQIFHPAFGGTGPDTESIKTLFLEADDALSTLLTTLEKDPG